MKPLFTFLAVVIVAVVGLFAFYMIDVDQTEEARLPDVDVSVEGGNLPEFDADVGEVELTEEQVTVTVPGIEITPPEADNAANN